MKVLGFIVMCCGVGSGNAIIVFAGIALIIWG